MKLLSKKQRISFSPLALKKANEFSASFGGKIVQRFRNGSPVVSLVGGVHPVTVRLEKGVPTIIAKRSESKQAKEKQFDFSATPVAVKKTFR